ncbi:MAG: 50S ribosomal protein L4 [bacterium]|nr:50S ribosomal protein L4 [bacterium]
MTVNLYNQKNEKAGAIDLPDRIFAVKWNPDLVHQALMTQLGNRRQPLAHAKGRGEVSGGGKKPWKQKGTGRARHGSIRSPIWKGGGVTHGPNKERVFTKKINKKMNRLAIFSVLSRKFKDGEVKIIEQFDRDAQKTGKWKEILKNISDLRSRTLLVSASINGSVHRAVRNIEKVDAIGSFSLNVYDLLKAKNIILEKESIKEMEKHYK